MVKIKDKISGNITRRKDGGWKGTAMENNEKRNIMEQDK
jgi:hypothetical protein